MKIDDLTLMSGSNVYIPELHLSIKQPKLIEISKIGEKTFYTMLSILFSEESELTKDDGTVIQLSPYSNLVNNILKSPRNFLPYLNVVADLFFDKYYWAIDDKTTELKLISKEEVSIPERLQKDSSELSELDMMELSLIRSANEKIIPEDFWEEFCDVIKDIVGLTKTVKKQKKKARSAKAQAILDKLAASQKKIEKQKKETEFKPVIWNNIGTLSTADGIPVNTILEEYTLLQLSSQLTRSIKKYEADKQYASLLQGAKLDKPLPVWIGESK